MDGDRATALRQLPAFLIPEDRRILRLLASCYLMCRNFFPDLSDARRLNAQWCDRYDALQGLLRTIVYQHSDAQMLLQPSGIQALRRLLRTRSAPEALAQCAALLYVLSEFVVNTQRSGLRTPMIVPASANLGQTEVLISMRRESVIAASLRRKPRQEAEISDMLERWYFPALHLSPVRVGNWSLASCNLSPGMEQLFTTRVHKRQVKIAVSPLTLDASLRGSALPGFPHHRAASFFLHTVGDETAQGAFLRTLLQQCFDQGIAILVLPELRVPPSLLQVIQDFLRQQRWDDLQDGKGLLLVVAGSWHYEAGTDRINRSYVLDAYGEVLWTHDKLAEYNLTAANVRSNPALKQQLGINDHGGIEAIRRGQTLQFCDCAFGRLAVAICAGFFHEPVTEVLRASGATIFLVPAMTSTMRPLEETARDLVRSQHAATFAANCGTMACDDPRTGTMRKNAACFYLLPHAGATPKRLRGTQHGYLHVFKLK